MATRAASTVWQPSTWSGQCTVRFNMRDLSRDDDFLSHLLIEKLGTTEVPLVVHKMDVDRRYPRVEQESLLGIIRRMTTTHGSHKAAVQRAVNELLTLRGVLYYIASENLNKSQVKALATHASRYFEVYLPGGSIEIAHTSRYAHRTGKSELCVLATRPLVVGEYIAELKGSLASLSDDEDHELKRVDERYADGVAIRRDFSVIHSKSQKKSHLFLGPARFVNHDCCNNVELVPRDHGEGRYISFRVIRPIDLGEEVTAHYGLDYFGKGNRDCLCATCEKAGVGAYGPRGLGSDDDLSDGGEGSSSKDDHAKSPSDEDEDEDGDDASDIEDVVPPSSRKQRKRCDESVLPEVERRGPIRLEVEEDNASDTASMQTFRPSGIMMPMRSHGLPTPDPEPSSSRGRLRSRADERDAASSCSRDPSSASPERFRSVISTRSQAARQASTETSKSKARGKTVSSSRASRSASAARQVASPPLTNESVPVSTTSSVRSSSRLRNRGPTADSSSVSTPVGDKGKGRATASVSDVRDIRDEPEPDVRVLRPRHIAPMFGLHGQTTKEPVDTPRGVDGKPLPTCINCKSVLPVISLNSEVVWGIFPSSGGKKGRPKKQDMECPRCIRHSAIYGCKWPDRIPTAGDSTPPNRTSTPHDTAHHQKALHPAFPQRNGVKLVSAPPKESHKRSRDLEEDDLRPSKKSKGPTGRPRGRPPKQTIGMSDHARALLNVTGNKASKFSKATTTVKANVKITVKLPTKKSVESASTIVTSAEVLTTVVSPDGRRSIRTRLPSLKVRETVPGSGTPTRLSPRKHPGAINSLSIIPSDEPPEVSASTDMRTEKLQTPKSLAVAAQPRDANGRFGKKSTTNGRFKRKLSHGHGRRSSHKRKTSKATNDTLLALSSEERVTSAVASTGQDQILDGTDANTTASHVTSELQYSASRLALWGDDEEMQSTSQRDYNDPLTDFPLLELPSDAETKYQAPEEDATSSHPHSRSLGEGDDENHPSKRARLDVDNDSETSPIRPSRFVGRGTLITPNPIAFARRKWAPAPKREAGPSTLLSGRISAVSYTEEESHIAPSDEEGYVDAGAPSPEAVDADDEDVQEDVDDEPSYQDEQTAAIPSASLTVPKSLPTLNIRPSPFNLARRRWAPLPSKFSDTKAGVTYPPSRPSMLPHKPYRTSHTVKRPAIPAHAEVIEICDSDEEPEAQLHSDDYDDSDLESPAEDEGQNYRLGIPRLRKIAVAPVQFRDEREGTDSSGSERMVERLVAVDSQSASTENTPILLPTRPPDLETSPGYAWKRTVLIQPDEAARLNRSMMPFPSTTLVRAGWDTGSDDTDC